MAQHASLRGIARQLAEVYYIVGAQQLDGYGQECFLGKFPIKYFMSEHALFKVWSKKKGIKIRMKIIFNKKLLNFVQTLTVFGQDFYLVKIF